LLLDISLLDGNNLNGRLYVRTERRPKHECMTNLPLRTGSNLEIFQDVLAARHAYNGCMRVELREI
jgi:hypothetical protein